MRNKIKVSLNSLEEYVFDLRLATNTPSSEFIKISKKSLSGLSQLNENILQIEDEYYAVARAKSSNISDKRTTRKLIVGGVDFIELRSLDLDPFSPIGIEKEAVFFLEVLLTYCFINHAKKITNSEIREIPIAAPKKG